MAKTEQERKPRFPKIGGNDVMDLHVSRKQRYTEGPPVFTMAHSRLSIDPRAQFALQCIERWALVAAEPDGEDSAGRQKSRRMTADELVGAACNIATEAFRQFTERGWSVDVPSFDEMIDAEKDIEDSND